MIKHIPVEVDADSLATLLLLDRSMEKLPEPIRMQPNVIVIIDFEVYKTFCQRELDKADYLAVPTRTLKQLLEVSDTVGLLRAFYLDMCYAVCKELHYAEAYHKDATKITHFVSDANQILQQDDIHRTYEQIKKDTAASIRSYMDAKNFPLPKKFREENNGLWEYANVLYFYAIASPVKWLYEIL